MKEIDPGHLYELTSLDGDSPQLLRFVKRVGDKFPGNQPPPYPGTTTQEVLRVLIKRAQYVDRQKIHYANGLGIRGMREYLWNLEERAAMRAGDINRMASANIAMVDEYQTCPTCGHIFCRSHR